MKNVTVTLDEEVARWARIQAAERDMSLSRFLGELLEERMRHEEAYETAMMRYLSRQPQPLRDDATAAYPRRQELHERDRLR